MYPSVVYFDIFSGFDDHLVLFFPMVWFIVFSLCLFLWGGFFSFCKEFYLLEGLIFMLNSKSRSFGMGGSSVFFSLFGSLCLLNLMGLIPYVFSVTSHLALNLCLSLPLWLCIVLGGMGFSFYSFLSHLQPVGAPVVLSPFLCLIELVSNLIRPVTLAVRLSANLSTGHIFLALLGGGFSSSLVVVLFGLFYLVFEIGVSFIQSYIFTLLPVLYIDEHPCY